MAKKVTETMKVSLSKNTLVDRGGGWLLDIAIVIEGVAVAKYNSVTAWANPSAAKRYVKTVVESQTTRRSIKLTATPEVDDKNKAVKYLGEMVYKAEV